MYSFLVEARDLGVPSLSSTALAIVKILDINDNRPIFKTLYYEQTVTDVLDIGQSILLIEATDLDDGTNGALHYSFSAADTILFAINSSPAFHPENY